jgi:hypothetical protein
VAEPLAGSQRFLDGEPSTIWSDVQQAFVKA